ncbi:MULTISPECIES: helix-turn-helix domain-containing protein [Pseudonocardia]|uniref:DNA-binding transcriptional repressor PuuR n=2 Tax=Pseudonocardia TaxID=1847 RepID=A0A1Y2N7Q5_PSEAH|nr:MULTISPECIES: XRE family transcriptional regulator [Pseudonocardia]OSY43483.1 DNA-binding transcriptional repressor PuuR [Pseudonocardia autotrophica]TDN73523.1 XRE family transcriptional regulator [Pseudonocardia autotrophica]BBG04266.1 transcriptional regulator [Pseudonocardia autotrophica]GEC25591.1 transcriptional regulator [Pseudonocardia saturnea]
MTRPATAADAPDDRNAPAGAEAEREAIVRSIGPKVRRLRHQAGLSLQQLARLAEVSSAAIHKVEKGDMVPTVTTLLKLAAALHRPIGYFVDADGEPTAVAHVVRADRRPEVGPPLPGAVRHGITGPTGRFTLHGTVTEVSPGGTLEIPPRSGEDLVTVLEGSVEFEVVPERHLLDEGDAVHFPADHEVRCHNPAGSPARLLWVSTGS